MKKLLKSKRLWFGLVALLLIGLIVNSRIQSTRDQSDIFVPNKDQIVNAKTQNIQNEITLSGSIDALEQSNVSFLAAGRLAWVGVKVGDHVRKWQTLASLDKTELRKQLAKDFNTYKTTLSTFDDTNDKYKKERDALILTDEMKRIIARSQHSLDNSVIDYELSDLAVKYASIYSPIDGIVTVVQQPVANVNILPANSAITVVNPNTIYFSSEIDEEDVINLKVGDPAKIKLDSFDKEFDSRVSYISFSPIEGRTSTVYEVRFVFPEDNKNMTYRIGMNGDATLITQQSADTLVLPFDAVLQESDGNYVLVKTDGNKLEKKKSYYRNYY